MTQGWCRGTELNCRHQPFQGCALPTELPRHSGWFLAPAHLENSGDVTGSPGQNQAGNGRLSLLPNRAKDLVWRRGRAFEVALRCFARAPARGPTPRAFAPLRSPREGGTPPSQPPVQIPPCLEAIIASRIACCFAKGLGMAERAGFEPATRLLAL